MAKTFDIYLIKNVYIQCILFKEVHVVTIFETVNWPKFAEQVPLYLGVSSSKLYKK